MTDQTPLVPASWGEVIDKITILEIKNQRIASEPALVNIRRELGALEAVVTAQLDVTPEIAALRDRLRDVNTRLWDIEDAIREHEQRQDFGASFIALARAVYSRTTNAPR